ncbi:MAG: recombinase family protein [Actinobacteria bacterium]|nr:recombinase family protein [Actinomycetota bacterium]
MAQCVIYARVSTKEQQSEGYSIPAQLKAMREFCARESLSPVAEFVEAESAGKAGRTQFGAMVAYLSEHPEVGIVVAHKLDRLYRNFRDQITLEDLGIRARYVVGDIPDTPQGELLRDVNLSVAKFYLGNLREEVKKGMDEKVAQGGWPHMAPSGYLNDRATRSLVADPVRSPLVRYAFERYATGAVSLSMLAGELKSRGFTSRSGADVGPSALHLMLKNPIYCGLIRYKGKTYPGTHEPIITPELFAAVQRVFEPNRNGVKETKHVFALRDFLTCGECGCKITAERQRGHAYYRCTHGKGKGTCTQATYAREEKLSGELAAILAEVEITPDIIEALVRDSDAFDAQATTNNTQEAGRLKREVAAADQRASRLLEGFLDGVVTAEVYHAKAEELAAAKRTLERSLRELSTAQAQRTSQVRALAETAATARIAFEAADTEGRRQVLATVLSNATVEGGSIASYQLKRPFEYLRRDPKGAFYHSWWAIQDLNL